MVKIVIDEPTTLAVQTHSVIFFQSQGGTQTSCIQSPVLHTLGCISSTNIYAVYLKLNWQNLGVAILKNGEIKMINSGNWSSKYPRIQVKCSTLVQTRQFERNNRVVTTKTSVPLDVEVYALCLDVNLSYYVLGNCNRNAKIIVKYCSVQRKIVERRENCLILIF